VRRAVAAAVFSVLLAAAPVSAADAAVPVGLSVSIHADSGQVQSGDRLAYTATVRNAGTDAVDGRLVVTVPGFVHIVEAEGADNTGLDATWTVTVAEGGTVTKKLIGELGAIPKGEVRVTTLVGLYLGDATQPAIRSADAAAIVGVRDPAHAVSDQAAKPAAAGLAIGWIGSGVGAVAVIATGAVWWLVRRRRTARRAVQPPGCPTG